VVNDNGRALRVLHVISTLRGYGAEGLVRDMVGLIDGDGIEAAALTVYDSKLTAEDRARFRPALLEVGRSKRSDLLFLGRFAKLIASWRPDVVHTHTHVGKYWGRLAALLAGAPVIVHTEHNPCDPRRNPLERIADRALDRGTARVVTFTREQADWLADFEGIARAKTAVIANGIVAPAARTDASRAQGRARLGAGADEFAVLMVGRIEYQKFHRLALEAVAALAPQSPVRLYLAGGGTHELELRAFVESAGIGGRVTFLGYRNDVGLLLHGADLMLMTSRFEGMPLALLEAMAAGTPVRTTPWIGAAEILEGGALGRLTRGWDPAELAAALEDDARDPAGLRERAERARAAVAAKYRIEQTAQAHREFYRTLGAGA
jgi:glycosyltransferase involved in cell wall biosynthesis